MGSSVEFDSDRRELLRERRAARIERKQQRRRAREHKHSHVTEPVTGLSAAQRLAEQDVRQELDRIVDAALDRHDSPRTSETQAIAPAAGNVPAMRATAPDPPRHTERRAEPPAASEMVPPPTRMVGERHVSRLARDVAEFRERREHMTKAACADANARIRQAGKPATAADALAAIHDPAADAWRALRDELDQTLANSRIHEVKRIAREGVRSASRDATRTSRRITHDPEIAYAVCVAYAIIARLPRIAMQIVQQRRREQGIAEFEERATKIVTLTRSEALQRIAREGKKYCVGDALEAAAHPEASPWETLYEQLSEAIVGGPITRIRAAARRAQWDAARDAARTSRHAPDREMAWTVAVAYAIIAEAPCATVRSRHADTDRRCGKSKRSRTAGSATRTPDPVGDQYAPRRPRTLGTMRSAWAKLAADVPGVIQLSR